MTPRLIAISEAVEKGTALCDVGTDHAYIPIYLAKNNTIKYAVASDINQGPLLRAMENIRKHGLEYRIKTVQSDGLDSIDMKEIETVIIAGMGGITIADIIKRAPKRGIKYILQPMTMGEELKRFLFENGFAVTGEKLAQEGGKIYNIISATDGLQEYSEMDLFIGKKLFGDPLLPLYKEKLRGKWETIIRERKKSNSAKTNYYEMLLKGLDEYDKNY